MTTVSARDATDEQLALAARDGDRDAFAILVGRYRDMARAFAYARLGSRDEAEDAAQDAFVKAFVSLDQFRGTGVWAAWMMRIVRNHCHDLQRRRQNVVTIPADWTDPSPGPESLVLADIEWKELADALGALPEKYRTPLVMHYPLGRTCAEIAVALGLKQSTVTGRVASGLRLIRGRLRRRGVI